MKRHVRSNTLKPCRAARFFWIMREFKDIPIERLSTSPYRAVGPLPYPSPARVADAMENGITEMVTVRRDPQTPGHYEILRGLDVWLLAQRADLTEVPALIRSVGDAEARALVRTESRDDPIAAAEAIQEFMESRGWSVAKVGRHLNLSRSTASHLLRLLKLGPEAQAGVRDGSISVTHAKLLLRLTPARQRKIAERIRREALSSRQVTTLIGAAGNVEPPPAKRFDGAARVEKDPHTLRLERDLGAILGNRVDIEYGPEGSGKLIVDFHNLDGLDGILERLGYRAH